MKQSDCDCIGKMDKLLEPKNMRLVRTVPFRDGDSAMVAVRVERIRTGRGTIKPVNVIASYCPFCGQKYNVAEGT